MALVQLIFTQNELQGDTRREEVVDTNSPRFLEIINMGGNPTVSKAPENARVGMLTTTRFINYREDKDMKHVEIRYHIVDDKLVILDFKPFKMRGYGISVTETDDGDMLELDLNNKNVVFVDRLQANDMINAIRRVQEINDGLSRDLYETVERETTDEDSTELN